MLSECSCRYTRNPGQEENTVRSEQMQQQEVQVLHNKEMTAIKKKHKPWWKKGNYIEVGCS